MMCDQANCKVEIFGSIKDELNLNPHQRKLFKALELEMVIENEGDGPYAFETILRSCVPGPIKD